MAKHEQERDHRSDFRWYDVWPIVVVLLIFFGFLVAQVSALPAFGSSLTARGQFGDAFGVLSSLFNGLAFAGLIITITLQSRELRLQRVELSAARDEMRGQREQLQYQSFALAKQNFEATFFRLVQMIDERASALPDPGPQDPARRGRGGFIRHVEQLRRVQQGAFTDPALTKDRAQSVYAGWFESAAPDLASYFQLLLETLKFVDQTQVGIQTASYAALVRAALSPAERTLLFYHAMFGGLDSAFPTLLRKHAVLCPADVSVPDEHRKWYLG
jgi:hypothetical protein